MALLSQDEALLSLLLPLGAPRFRFWVTQGVASLRSLALGWELIAPSGRADVAGGDRGDLLRRRRGVSLITRAGNGRHMGSVAAFAPAGRIGTHLA